MYISNPYCVSEIILSYIAPTGLHDRPKVKSVDDAYQLLLRHWDENKIGFIEEVKVLLLNRGNRVLGIHSHSSGGVASATVDPKLVFAAAIKANASGFIIAHNHPSGEVKPSDEDKAITDKLRKGAQVLDICFLDHLIITPNAYYSFAEEMEHHIT